MCAPQEMAQRLHVELKKKTTLHSTVRISDKTRRWIWTLTAGRSVPGRPVDGSILLGEVFCVTDPSAGISHEAVGGSVREGQPAEDVVIRGGGLLPSHPLGASSVIWEGHHQLASLEIPTQHKRHFLHPCYQRSCLQGNLQQAHTRGMDNVISTII